MTVAVRVKGVSKEYRLGELRGYKTLRESLTGAFTLPDRRGNASNGDDGPRGRDDRIWALKDVSFDVEAGEVLGIIGANGAGKTTLLKILSRITEPTAGEIELFGRVSSLLEVGTGFHPELTGRENIFLNGSILGMRRREIAQKFDEIVDFSGVERFLDTPVKRYSSGMQVRLAFAVAAHLEPEILLVDEVLAVGDAEFQRKCLGKMGDIADSGRTIILVSHNMAAVENLCASCVLLEKGSVLSIGSTHNIVNKYFENLYGTQKNTTNNMTVKTTDSSIIRYFQIYDNSGNEVQSIKVGDQITVQIHLEAPPILRSIILVVSFYDQFGSRVLVLESDCQYDQEVHLENNTILQCKLASFRLFPERYRIGVAVFQGAVVIDSLDSGLYLDVLPTNVYRTGKIPPRKYGTHLPEVEWSHSCL